jgi:hypothetical protein
MDPIIGNPAAHSYIMSSWLKLGFHSHHGRITADRQELDSLLDRLADAGDEAEPKTWSNWLKPHKYVCIYVCIYIYIYNYIQYKYQNVAEDNLRSFLLGV